MNPRFLIEIIIEARNKISATLQKAAADIDKVTKAQDRGAKSDKERASTTRATAKSIEDATKRFDSYTAALERGERKGKVAIDQLKAFQREFTSLGNRAQSGSKVADNMYEMATAARQAAEEIKKTTKAVEDSAQKATQARKKEADSFLADIRREMKADQDRSRQFDQNIKSGEAQYRRRILTIQKGRDAMEEADAVARRLEATATRSERKGGFLSRILGVDEGKVSAINRALHDFESSANRGGFSAVRLAGNLRGMVIVGAIGFFQQLIGVGVSLGGTLVAVAASAVQAGAALGGALVAGASQAIPVIGLLAAAWGRVGAVFDALKARQKAQRTASDDGTTAAEKQASAADALANAQDALAEAHRRVTQAQQDLTQARFDAGRQIQDLIAAERQAQLQAEGAALAQSDAQRALRRSLSSGNVDDLAAQSLQVRSTSLGLFTSRRDAGRATFDAARARAGGGAPGRTIDQAKQALADANRSVVQAQRSLDAATRSASQTTDAVSSTQKMLSELVAQLSPAEHRLFDILSRVQDRYKKVFTGKGGVLEPIINTFSYAGNRILHLLDDPKLISAARSLAEGIATQLKRLTDWLSSNRMVSFFETMAKEAKRNLPVVTNLLMGIGDLIQSIAITAGPALHDFLQFLSDLFDTANNATSSDGGMARLQKFFSQGEKYAESFFKLGIAISQLFLAVIGAGAEEGGNAIDSLTGKIKEATAWVNDNQEKVREFFREAIRSTGFVLDTIWELTKTLFSFFNEKQVEAFSTAFTKTLLPALKDALTVLGFISNVFLDIISTDAGSALFKVGLSALLITKFVSPIVSLFSKLVILLATLGGPKVLGVVLPFLTRLRSMVGPLAVIATTMLALGGHIHSVTDALKALTPVVATLVGLLLFRGGLGGGLGALTGALKGLFKRGGGAAAGLEAEGVAAGGILSVGLKSALKKAGWLGVGVSAAEGIIEGLSTGSVRNGVRDFAHSITLGLVDSTAEVVKKSIAGINKTLGTGVPIFTQLQRVIGGRRPLKDKGGFQPESFMLTQTTDFGNRTDVNGKPLGVQTSQVRQLTEFGKDIQKLRDSGKGALADAAEQLNSFYLKLAKFRQNKDLYGMGNLREQASKLGEKFPELSDAIDAFAGRTEKSMDRVRAALAPQQIARDLAAYTIRYPAKWKEIVDGSLVEIKKLPPGARKEAKQATDEIIGQLERAKEITPQQAEDMRKRLDSKFQQYEENVHDHSVKARDAFIGSIGAMIKASTLGLQGIVKDASGVLKQLGFKGLDFKATPNSVGKLLGAGLQAAGTLFRNTGGPIPGVGNSDTVSTRLTPGEHVWTKGEVQSAGGHGAMYAMRRFFGGGGQSRRGGFYSDGGFVNNVGAHVDTPGERAIASALQRLGQFLHIVFSPVGPRSARRTLAENFQVGGAAGSDHLSGNAMDVAPEAIKTIANSVLNRFGLNRPIPGNWTGTDGLVHDERNHLTLLSGAAAKIIKGIGGTTSALTDVIRKITAPKISGSGGLHDIAQGLLDRVAKSANKKISGLNVGGSSADFSGILGQGGSVAANVALGKKMAAAYGWVGAQWNALKTLWTGESGWRTNADNSTSTAYGIPQGLEMPNGHPELNSPGPYRDYHTNPRTQIKWGLNYIKGGYGSPAAALAHWLSLSPHSYGVGGSVDGSGPVRATLHGGEHVWTAAEVLRAGGHKVMYALRSMLGGGGQGQGSYKDGGRVLAIGDSLGQGVEQYLKKAIKNIDIDAEKGRSSDAAVALLEKRIKKAYTSVILDIGSNDAGAHAFAKSLKTALKIVGGDRDLIVPLLRGPGSENKNKVLQAIAGRHANLTAVAVRGMMDPDDPLGLHYTGTGYQTRSRSIVAGLAGVRAGRAVGSALGGDSGYQQPLVHGVTVGALSGQINAAQKLIGKFPSSKINNKFTDALSKTFREMLGDGGLLDQISDAVQKRIDKLAVGLQKATYKITKGGDAKKRLSDTEIANRTIENLNSVYGALNTEQNQIQQSLADVAKRLKTKGLSDKKRAYLQGIQRDLQTRLDDVNAGIADNVAATYQAVEDQVNAYADKANTKASKKLSTLDILQRIRDLAGGTALSAAHAQTNEQLGQNRAGIIGQQIDGLRKASRVASKAGRKDLVNQIAAQIADLQVQALEAVRDGISKDVDEVNRQAGRRQAVLDIRSRIATALGRTDAVIGIIGDQIKSTVDQISLLTKQQSEAKSKGFTDLAETIGGQIDDLQTSIVELTAQRLQGQIDQINNAASRRNTQLDLSNRLADLQEKAGNSQGAFGVRGSVLVARGANIQSQMGGLNNMLMQAMLQGNQGAADSLRDQIAELDVQLQENTAAIASNTVQARQAAINAITGRGSFLGGVYGGLNTLVQALGTQNGTVDLDSQKSLVQQVIQTLRQTGGGLADQLFSGFGIDLRNFAPGDLVKALSGLNYDGIEAGFSVEQKTQFEDLINAIIGNASAISENTTSLNELNGVGNVQGFTSTAWQWFRNAVFNGSGGLLSQYQIPTGGLSYAGSATGSMTTGMRSGDTYIDTHVTQTVEEADPDIIASRIGFQITNLPAS